MKAESAWTWEGAAFEGESFSKQKYVIALNEKTLISAKWPQSIAWLLCASPRRGGFVPVFILHWG